MIPCARSLPSRSRFHSLFLATPLSLSLRTILSRFISPWPFSEYPSALFTSSLPRVTRPFCVVFLLSSSLTLSFSLFSLFLLSADALFLHLFSSLSLPFLSLSFIYSNITRASRKEGRREKEGVHVLEGVVPSSIATAVSAFLRSAPHTRCRYILSV